MALQKHDLEPTSDDDLWSQERFLILVDPKTKDVIPFEVLGATVELMHPIVEQSLYDAKHLTGRECNVFADIDKDLFAEALEENLFCCKFIDSYKGVINFSLYYPTDGRCSFTVYIDSKYNHLDNSSDNIEEESLIFPDLHHVTILN